MEGDDAGRNINYEQFINYLYILKPSYTANYPNCNEYYKMSEL